MEALIEPFKTETPCEVHKTHTPQCHINEIHHVWPLGDNGPDIPENKVVVCATGHNSIHDLINKLRKAWGDAEPVPWSVLRTYTTKERQLAKLGWDRIQRQAM